MTATIFDFHLQEIRYKTNKYNNILIRLNRLVPPALKFFFSTNYFSKLVVYDINEILEIDY